MATAAEPITRNGRDKGNSRSSGIGKRRCHVKLQLYRRKMVRERGDGCVRGGKGKSFQSIGKCRNKRTYVVGSAFPNGAALGKSLIGW